MYHLASELLDRARFDHHSQASFASPAPIAGRRSASARPKASSQSTTKKNIIISPTMMNTITVVSHVSFQVGQVTFDVSR